jgi:hypothetical protein
LTAVCTAPAVDGAAPPLEVSACSVFIKRPSSTCSAKFAFSLTRWDCTFLQFAPFLNQQPSKTVRQHPHKVDIYSTSREKEKTDLMSASKWNGGVFFHIKQTGYLKVDMDKFQQN